MLLENSSFERWEYMFGVRTKKYHTDNRSFAENPFRDAVDENNKVIKFYGIGSRHQNDIAKRESKILTLGEQKFLLHYKQYWPEGIITSYVLTS